MTSICTTPEKDGKKNIFLRECRDRVFIPVRYGWDSIKENYFDYINRIKDPILRHISIYFVQHYIDGYNYYHNSELVEINGACYYLNRWLEERKDLFTYGEQCPTKKESWDNAINTLWGMLKKDYPTSKKDGKPWCDKSTIKLTTKYPLELTSLKCDETISPETKSEELSPQSFDTNCKCPPSEVPAIPLLPDQSPEKDPTKNIAVTSGFTAVGTLGTLFFLYRFTPMASWFRRPGMSNIGTGLYMDQGGADSFLRMQGGDGGNNLFYHPSV